MKLTPDGQLLAVLQHTVSAALKQWLDDNKADLLRVAREAVFESGVAAQQLRQQAKRNEFLTVAEVAQRWQLHPESVRRMIRQGRVPRVVVGRRSRVALTTVEAMERTGTVL